MSLSTFQLPPAVSYGGANIIPASTATVAIFYFFFTTGITVTIAKPLHVACGRTAVLEAKPPPGYGGGLKKSVGTPRDLSVEQFFKAETTGVVTEIELYVQNTPGSDPNLDWSTVGQGSPFPLSNFHIRCLVLHGTGSPRTVYFSCYYWYCC